MIYFIDTSALVKLYHQEAGTEYMDTVFRDAESTLLISELTIVELHSALAKKIRIREISPAAAEDAARRFRMDCTQMLIVLLLDSTVLVRAKELIDRYGNMIALRTLDAIQLAACQTQRDNGVIFVSADDQLCEVCKKENLTFLNPEKTSIPPFNQYK